MRLEPMTVRDFYTRLTGLLDGMGLAVDICPGPVELPDAIPSLTTPPNHSYDPRSVTEFWRALVEAERVLLLPQRRAR